LAIKQKTPIGSETNGVYMKLANFRAVDPLHTSQGKRGLSRGVNGVAALWEEFSDRSDELKFRESVANGSSPNPDVADEIAEALEGRLLTRMHLRRERNRVLIRKKREAVLVRPGVSRLGLAPVVIRVVCPLLCKA
jgi:5-methylcytosine-specific restriction enzyme A